jgi:hypothetical protein
MQRGPRLPLILRPPRPKRALEARPGRAQLGATSIRASVVGPLRRRARSRAEAAAAAAQHDAASRG